MSDLQAELDRLIKKATDANQTYIDNHSALASVYYQSQLELEKASERLGGFILDHRAEISITVKDAGVLEWVVDPTITVVPLTRIVGTGEVSKWEWSVIGEGTRKFGLADTEAEARAAAEQWVRERRGTTNDHTFRHT